MSNLSDLTIVRAVPEDAEALLAYTKTAGAETDNLSFGAEGLDMTAEEVRDMLTHLEHSRYGLILLAKSGGRIVGIGSFTIQKTPRMRHRGEVAVSVLQSYWNNGIGSTLLSLLIRFGREIAGVDQITLDVRSDNERAIRLYRKFGFEKTGVFPGYVKINDQLIDCDLMVLRFR